MRSAEVPGFRRLPWRRRSRSRRRAAANPLGVTTPPARTTAPARAATAAAAAAPAFRAIRVSGTRAISSRWACAMASSRDRPRPSARRSLASPRSNVTAKPRTYSAATVSRRAASPMASQERDGGRAGDRRLVAPPEPARPGEADRPIGPARVVDAQTAQHPGEPMPEPRPSPRPRGRREWREQKRHPEVGVGRGHARGGGHGPVHGPTHPPRRGNGDRGAQRLRAQREVVEARVGEAARRGDVADLLGAGLERAREGRGRRDAGRRGGSGPGSGGAHGAAPTGRPRSTVAIACSAIAPATSTSVVCWSPRHPGIPLTSITSTRPSSACRRSTPA